jgi:hypothetical protein
MLRVKPRVGPLTRSGVAYNKITLRSVGFAFAGFGGLAVGLGPAGACL